MKSLQSILIALFNVFFTSADPNLFGSRKRRKEKERLAGEAKAYAAETQEEIDALKVQNPFESAAAKSAMAASQRKARQTQQRFANMMGGNSNPEALVAAQGATQEAVAGTAGDIAVGAEAMKKQEIGQLRAEKAAYRGQSQALSQAAANERGAGWKDFFSMIGGTVPFTSGFQGGAQAAQQ